MTINPIQFGGQYKIYANTKGPREVPNFDERVDYFKKHGENLKEPPVIYHPSYIKHLLGYTFGLDDVPIDVTREKDAEGNIIFNVASRSGDGMAANLDVEDKDFEHYASLVNAKFEKIA